MTRAFAELSEDGRRIEVYFEYEPTVKNAVKAIPGAQFVGRDKGGPFWTLPLDLTSGERLREVFGPYLKLGDAVKEWGRRERDRDSNLRAIAEADSADLARVPEKLPEAAALIANRPYQSADIAMMAAANILNANQPGTGKSIEAIGAIFEAGIEEGPHLISAPVRSLENVWAEELARQPCPIYTAEDRAEREAAIREGLKLAKAGQPVWIVLNPDMIRLAKKGKNDSRLVVHRDHKGNEFVAQNELHAELLQVSWRSVTIDEGHKAGLGNPKSLFSMGIKKLRAEKRQALTGTPMGGKPVKLFSYFQFLEPENFTSLWRWADQWLDISSNGFGKEIGDIKSGREDAFYAAHSKLMVRRLKREALPGLPAKVFREVKCRMTKGQRKQYEKFAKDAEIRIDEEHLVGANVLAEYARLKQFANAKCEVRVRTNRKGESIVEPWPTKDSGKLPQLIEKLDEQGIRKDDPEPGARAIVSSQSSRMVEMVARYLNAQGIRAEEFTGKTKDSRPIISRFQSDDPEPFVIVMTTDTGGVSLNLERAGSVHILDESWNPDDEEQLEDRGDRGSRETPLITYYYRTRDTVQQYVAEVAAGKRLTNANVLDYRQKGLRA